jgi:hypothetical protein
MGATFEAGITPGILPSALWLFRITPGDLVKIDILICQDRGGAAFVHPCTASTIRR